MGLFGARFCVWESSQGACDSPKRKILHKIFGFSNTETKPLPCKSSFACAPAHLHNSVYGKIRDIPVKAALAFDAGRGGACADLGGERELAADRGVVLAGRLPVAVVGVGVSAVAGAVLGGAVGRGGDTRVLHRVARLLPRRLRTWARSAAARAVARADHNARRAIGGLLHLRPHVRAELLPPHLRRGRRIRAEGIFHRRADSALREPGR